MSKEIHEAAARLAFSDYQYWHIENGERERDAETIAKSWLERFQSDDDEPVTEDWLYKIAEPSQLSVTAYGFSVKVGSLTVRIEPYSPHDKRWHVLILQGNDTIHLYEFKTRGRLRRLLKVLEPQ